LFVATGLPAGASSYAWNPVGIITNVAGGVSNGNVVAFSTPGLTQLVSVTYGACSVAATVNVFAVQSVAFEEFSAGTTNSVLAANPNAGGGLQIFPDRLTPTDTTNHAVVLVSATVTPPLSNIVVYFTAFDADDPTTNAAPVDNEAVLQDNRGSVGGLREGLLAVASALTGTNGVATNLFTVTMQPGDNFRVVAHCDPTFAGGYMAQTNSSGGEIVSTNGVTPIAPAFVTDLLTVWRRLHIEVDSMGSVVSNFVAGQITKMDGVNFEGVTSIVSSVNFNTGLGDGSPNLDSTTPRNGRFENGNITVGPSQHFTADLLGNGNTRVAVKSNTYFNIGFILTKGTNSLLGRVVSLRQTPPRFMVKPTIPPGTFNGGSLGVAGHTFSVNSAGGNSIIVNAANPTLDFTLRDDDDQTLLPRLPDTTDVPRAFQPAYVVPFLVAPSLNATSQTVFALNVNTATNSAAFAATIQATFRFDNVATEASPEFWTVYVNGAYQPSVLEDRDAGPPAEGAALATVDKLRGQGANCFLEVLRETPVTPFVSEALTVSHEIGHLFGGSHDSVNGFDGGLMDQSHSRTNINFTPVTLEKIRNSPHP
jgi:hypothetical protein